MKQILIELDERTAARLEQVAPARARARSRFVREAIERALDAVLEARTEAAYRARPDDAPVAYDPATWDEWKPKRPSRSGRRKRS